MTSPAAPFRFQPQLPDSRCVIAGHALGGESCTCYAFAMATDQASLNRVRLTGCDFRASTNDVAGGTTLSQNAPLARLNGVPVDVYAGAAVLTVWDLAVRVQAGRGAVIQIGTRPMLSTIHRSTAGAINHAVFVSRVRGGSLGTPSEALVYDPCADGRNRTYHVDQGPSWWPWSLVRECLAALQPWGEDDPRTLGHGKAYAALFPDTEPHAHFRYGGEATKPFPDRVRVNVAELWSHSSPRYGKANRIHPRLQRNELFVAFQRVTKSGVLWLGSHQGDRWVPASKVRNIGGTQ